MPFPSFREFVDQWFEENPHLSRYADNSPGKPLHFSEKKLDKAKLKAELIRIENLHNA